MAEKVLRFGAHSAAYLILTMSLFVVLVFVGCIPKQSLDALVQVFWVVCQALVHIAGRLLVEWGDWLRAVQLA